VFSTLHTNNAIGAIPRLVDMGVDPYLIAPTLVLSIAQRLVRTISPGSEGLLEQSDAMKVMIEKQFEDLPAVFKKEININRPFYEARPTEESSTGMRGRVAVFEIFPVDKEIERIILAEPTEPRLWEAARKKGMLTMKEDAMLKCMDKIIPFQEIGGL